MKLTPPGKDMNVWTVLWVVLGCVGLYFGVTDASRQTIVVSLVQIVGGVGMWVGLPSAKWLLIAFFCLGVVGRIHTLIYGHFHPSILTSTIFFAFLVVRFILWRPPITPPSLPVA